MAEAELAARAEARGVEVAAPLALPERAAVHAATVAVHAEPPGAAVPLAQVARIRAADGSDPSAAYVVDFGGLVTVGGLTGPNGPVQAAPWLGAAFGEPAPLQSELRADRLLVRLPESVPVATFATQSTVMLPAPPADLDLAVGGTRQWFAAGPARAGATGAFDATVDVTAGVRAAVAAGRLPVEVALRASAPGLLRLSSTVRYLEVHEVEFPEGPARTVEAPAEGTYPLALPLPAEAAGWRVHAVQGRVAARLGPERILPARDPGLSADAQIVLDPDHGIAVRLPDDELARFAQLTAIRLPLAAGPEGAELAGTLLGRDDQAPDEPGAPLADTQLGPLALDPGRPFDPTRPAAVAWATLALATPRERGRGPLWASLELARGEVLWPLAADPGAQTTVRRSTPSGWAALSSVAGVETGAAPLRVAGIAPAHDPVAALEVGLPGGEPPHALTPTAEGTPFSVAAVEGAEPLAGTALTLELTVAAPGSYAFAGVRIEYTTEVQ